MRLERDAEAREREDAARVGAVARALLLLPHRLAVARLASHAEAGAAAGALDGLLAVGEHAEVTAQAAREAGVCRVAVATDVDEAVVTLRDWLQSGDVVLLKASRAVRLDEVCQQF